MTAELPTGFSFQRHLPRKLNIETVRFISTETNETDELIDIRGEGLTSASSPARAPAGDYA